MPVRIRSTFNILDEKAHVVSQACPIWGFLTWMINVLTYRWGLDMLNLEYL